MCIFQKINLYSQRQKFDMNKEKLNINPILFPNFDLKRPLIISGPCSAETEKQTVETAKALSELGIKVFRAGVWKPRTRPGLFEGVGKKGLQWLNKVKEITGMFVCVEVANSQHVAQALEYKVDAVWIGSRTTVNPFIVQEIADALAGSDLTLFVKNPVNPDIDLWIGALERVNRAGITKLAAIHRGFSVYGQSNYRNPPQWQIPIELHRLIPNLPILTDPSHICGNPVYMKEICQKAMDLNFLGLMIESHISPEESLSDKEQQIEPQKLKELIESLVIRSESLEKASCNTLNDYRSEIDVIDTQIIALLKERMEISKRIGKYKQKNNITIFQSDRYNELMESRKKVATQAGLKENFISEIFKSIHEESINKQVEIMNESVPNP